MYIKFNNKNNKEDPKLDNDDHVRISKYENIFGKDYVPNWTDEVFVTKKVKNTVPWTYGISNLKVKRFLERFANENCKKQSKKNLV